MLRKVKKAFCGHPVQSVEFARYAVYVVMDIDEPFDNPRPSFRIEDREFIHLGDRTGPDAMSAECAHTLSLLPGQKLINMTLEDELTLLLTFERASFTIWAFAPESSVFQWPPDGYFVH